MTLPSSSKVTSRVSANRDSYAAARDQYIRIEAQSATFPAVTDDNLSNAFDRNRPIFVQYLNPEIRACYGKMYRPRSAARDLADALHATRLAILSTENVLCIPVSYFFEVPILPAFLGAIEALRWQNCIQYSSNMSDLHSYMEAYSAFVL